jgi:hypothetical protein
MLATAFVLLLPLAAGAGESSTEARLRDALRASTSQLRAAEDDRTRLQAESAEQKKELEALKAKLAAAQAAPRPAPKTNDRELAELGRKLDAQTEAAGRLSRDLIQCQTVSREGSEASRAAAREAARQQEEERARSGQLGARVEALAEQLNDCRARNASMYSLAGEVLTRYQKVGLREVISAREPFVGKKRVELENLAQDYEDKLRDQKVAPAPRP